MNDSEIDSIFIRMPDSFLILFLNSVDGDPESLLNFDFFSEMFMGKCVTTRQCFSCETESDIPEDIIVCV